MIKTKNNISNDENNLKFNSLILSNTEAGKVNISNDINVLEYDINKKLNSYCSIKNMTKKKIKDSKLNKSNKSKCISILKNKNGEIHHKTKKNDKQVISLKRKTKNDNTVNNIIINNSLISSPIKPYNAKNKLGKSNILFDIPDDNNYNIENNNEDNFDYFEIDYSKMDEIKTTTKRENETENKIENKIENKNISKSPDNKKNNPGSKNTKNNRLNSLDVIYDNLLRESRNNRKCNKLNKIINYSTYISSTNDDNKKTTRKLKLKNVISNTSQYLTKPNLTYSTNIKIKELDEKKNDNFSSNNIKEINNENIFLLELNEDGIPNLNNNQILSCNVGTTLIITLNSGIKISNEISLITNAEKQFLDYNYLEKSILDNSNNKKSEYQILPYKTNSKIFFKITCKISGNIILFFKYKDSFDNNKFKYTEKFHILVNPIIDLSNENKKININDIKLQTVITKNIGKIPTDFNKYYEQTALLGYNFIHFKALQKLSNNGNLNSIIEHNSINQSLFSENKYLNISEERKFSQFSDSISFLKKQYHIGAIADLIINQTSIESEWIIKHPECGYNLKNTPWLSVSYELDYILKKFSNLFYDKEICRNFAPNIKNQQDLDYLINELNSEIGKDNLEEYFKIDIESCSENFIKQFRNFIIYQNTKSDIDNRNYLYEEIKKLNNTLIKIFPEKKNILNDIEKNSRNILNDEELLYEIIKNSCVKYGYKRFGVELPSEFITILLIEKFRNKNSNNNIIPEEQYFINEINNYIAKINNDWSEKCKQMLNIAILNIKEIIRYKFIQLNYDSTTNELIDSYFLVIDPSDPKKILLKNGWIMQSADETNVFPNITEYGTWYFFKREVIIWNDTIKINYGNKLENTPIFIINYMKKYICNFAKIFDGFYIESITNIPLFILKYFIFYARKINPNLILITQIPLIDRKIENDNYNNDEKNTENLSEKCMKIKSIEKRYSEEIGVNLFVHELIRNSNSNDIFENIINNVNFINNNNLYSDLILSSDDNLYKIAKISNETENNILFKNYKYLTPIKPNIILFDLTQDNQTYYEKYNFTSIQLSILSSIGLLNCSIGSTMGFDDLFLHQISSQKESRIYKIESNELLKLYKEINNINNNKNEIKEIKFEYLPNVNTIKTPSTVKLAISYHNFVPDIHLSKINKQYFMTTLKLPKSKYYYRYLIDDEKWTYDESKPTEKDIEGNINNILDLSSPTKINVKNLKLLRSYINSIRDVFIDKDNQTSIIKNEDIICVIKTIVDFNSLTKAKNDFVNKKNIYKNIRKQKNNIYFSCDLLSMDKNLINNKKENLIIMKDCNSYDGYAIITRPFFENKKNNNGVGQITIPGNKIELISVFFSENEEEIDYNKNDKKYLIGINGNIFLDKNINFLNCIADVNYLNDKTIIKFIKFPANCTIILKYSMDSYIRKNIDDLNKYIKILFNKGYEYFDYFDSCDINKILFRTVNEENDGDESVEINEIIYNGCVDLVFTGISYLMQIFKKIKNKEIEDKNYINLFYNKISVNDNYFNYLMTKIKNIKSLRSLNNFLNKNIINNYRLLPNYMKIIYFEKIITSIYKSILHISLITIPNNILSFNDFGIMLFMTRYQFIGHVNSSSFIGNLGIKQKNINKNLLNISISSGLPFNEIAEKRMHFRDVLISFKSLFLIPKYFEEAETILKIIASTIRHGLIPDQFNCGKNPRYNSRDTCWYFINAIKNYISYTNNINFLKEEIELIFCSDKSYKDHIQKKNRGEKKIFTIEYIIQLIFQSHGNGIHFCEWENDLPENKDLLNIEGCNIDIILEQKNGFLYGGNHCNAGTWMNKFKYIENKKIVPETHRAGANIEIIALLYSALDFIINMGKIGVFQYMGITFPNGRFYTFHEWKSNIKKYFEIEFFVKIQTPGSSIKGNIYKDYCSFLEKDEDDSYEEDYNKKNDLKQYQFRPNFLIAIYYAPELFTRKNVIKVLKNVEKYLLRNDLNEEINNNIIGLKTLDIEDDEYKGVINRNEIIYDINIHNGIEHVWLYGLYLIIKTNYFFEDSLKNENMVNKNKKQTKLNYFMQKLIPVINTMKNNKWMGLPEMTDENGKIIEEGNQTDLKANAMFFELIDILSELNININEKLEKKEITKKNSFQSDDDKDGIKL